MRKHPAALTAAAAALLVFFAVTFAYPLSRMLAQITPEGAAVFSSTVFRRAVGSSCLSGALTVLFALPLAMLMALLTESTRVRCRALWRGIFVLPMLLPSVSQGTGLVLLLGTNGLLTRGLRLPGSIYGLQGIVLGQVLYTAPIAYLLLANLLRYRSRSPYDAARLAGVPPLFRWSGITLPFLRKELLAAAFLVFSLSVTDYGIPLAVGGKVKTLASVMYSSVVGQLDFGRGCVIEETVAIEAQLDDAATAGPRAYLRPGTHMLDGSKAGTHVEIKKSTIGRGSKVPHLSYIGDTTMGEGVNIGAGSITCNYDGVHKHKTVIGKDAFIGSDTMMVAPAQIGDGALVTDQIPAAGAELPGNSEVILYMGQEPPEDLVTVPDFTGMTIGQANQAAANAGLYILVKGATEDSGYVTATGQDVEPGTSVVRGSTIRVDFVDHTAQD